MRLPLPTSSIINFAAFIFLFAVITLLYHIGGRIETQHKPTDTQSLQTAHNYTKPQDKHVPTPLRKRPAVKSSPRSVTAAATVSDNAAKIIETTQEPTPEKPRTWPKTPSPLPSPLRGEGGVRGGFERLITAEELDSEEARQGYLAANRKVVTQNPRPGTRNPKPENHEAYFPTGNLFIPFEKRK